MSDLDEIPQADQIEGAPHPRDTLELFGQANAEAAFLDAYTQDHLHHGWLVTGPRGVGKATLVWRIVRFLMAQPPKGGMFDAPLATTLDSDPNHPAARQIMSLAHPGVYLCRRPWDEKAKRLKTVITVEEVRGLKSFFNLSSTDGGWRVAIIDAAEDMNPSAANAVLKVLEEPPARTLLFLISHQPARLLPTIRSRCRELRCKTLSPDDLAQSIAAAGFEVPADQAQALAELSGGSAGQAIGLLANGGIEIYDQIIGLLRSAPRISRPRILALADKCAGRDGAAYYDMVVQLSALALARLARQGAIGGEMARAAPAEAEVAARFASNPHQARIWADLLQELTGRTAHARAVNLDPGQVILDMFLKIDAAAGRATLLSA